MDRKTNTKRWLAVFAIGMAYGVAYLLANMKYTFYDQMHAATGFSNEQIGVLFSWFSIVSTLSYLPGGFIADKVKPRILLTVCLLANAGLCFVFLGCYTNYTLCMVIWLACAFTGNFAFWPAMYKAIRMLGTKSEQGRINSVFEAFTGVSGFAISLLMVRLAASAEGVEGFKLAVIAMGVSVAVVAFLVYVLVDVKVPINEDALEESNEKFSLKEYLKVIIMPEVLIPALLLFGGISCYAGLSLTNNYLSGVVRMTVVAAATVGTFRSYACRFASPIGGFMADKVYKGNVAKWQLTAFPIMILALLGMCFLPKNSVVQVGLVLLLAVAVYSQRSTTYAMLTEFKVPYKYNGIAVSTMTVIGYSPDMFMHGMFGKWLDTYPIDTAYKMIWLFVAGVCAVCIVIALFALKLSKKHRLNPAQA